VQRISSLRFENMVACIQLPGGRHLTIAAAGTLSLGRADLAAANGAPLQFLSRQHWSVRLLSEGDGSLFWLEVSYHLRAGRLKPPKEARK